MHVECSIMRNVMASATEAELGGLFEKCQKAKATRTPLNRNGPPTTTNTGGNEKYRGKNHRQRNGKTKNI